MSFAEKVCVGSSVTAQGRLVKKKQTGNITIPCDIRWCFSNDEDFIFKNNVAKHVFDQLQVMERRGYYIKQRPWTPTERRGTIDAEFRTPSPAAIALPSSIGKLRDCAFNYKLIYAIAR